MKQWKVLFKKELKESGKNMKWVWVPLVFLVLGIMQPVISYYMADLLSNFGGMPDGAAIQFPVPETAQVLSETFGQFSQIGILVLVLSFMGIIAGERSKGTHIMILVKPVKYVNFLTSKWAHMILMTTVSFLVGYAGAIYYTFLLFDDISISRIIGAGAVYLLSLIFVMTVVFTLSGLFKSSAFVAFISLSISIGFSLVTALFKDYMLWSPGRLSTHSHSIFSSGQGDEAMWLSIISTVLIIIGLLVLTNYIFKSKELSSETT